MDAPGSMRVYRCATCGTEATAARASAICCCGIKMRTGRNAGIRCMPNPERTPEVPAEIVAEQVAQ